MKTPPTDYLYIGKQKGDNNIEDLQLYNCQHCHTTIVGNTPEKLMKHLETRHYTRYYEIMQKRKEIIAQNYLLYITRKE